MNAIKQIFPGVFHYICMECNRKYTDTSGSTDLCPKCYNKEVRAAHEENESPSLLDKVWAGDFERFPREEEESA